MLKMIVPMGRAQGSTVSQLAHRHPSYIHNSTESTSDKYIQSFKATSSN